MSVTLEDPLPVAEDELVIVTVSDTDRDDDKERSAVIDVVSDEVWELETVTLEDALREGLTDGVQESDDVVDVLPEALPETPGVAPDADGDTEEVPLTTEVTLALSDTEVD